jgi:hypothetical protein
MLCNTVPDLSKLTDLQCSVWLKDQDGLRPIEIGEQLGLTPRRVCNIKARLRVLGFPVNDLWSAKRLQAEMYGPSQFEPEDDEEPDRDEPVQMGPVQRCACGLVMPCNDHDSINPYLVGVKNRNNTTYPDGDEDDSW